MHQMQKKHGQAPVVELKVNLYGHPKAGLYWEEHCHAAIKRCGFEPVEDWECLFKHHEKQLFLSVYVDDFKMGGRKGDIADMWKVLGKDCIGGIILDDPTPITGNVYLGSEQTDVPNDERTIREKIDLSNKMIGTDDKHRKYCTDKVKSWEYTMSGHTGGYIA